MKYMDYLPGVAAEDVRELQRKDAEYGGSWLKRGGTGAFHMLARKIDRLEEQAKRFNYNVLAAIEADQRPEGILDDIRDLRRYLMLVECEALRASGAQPSPMMVIDGKKFTDGMEQPFGFDKTQDITEMFFDGKPVQTGSDD